MKTKYCFDLSETHLMQILLRHNEIFLFHISRRKIKRIKFGRKMPAEKKTSGIWCKMSYYIQHELDDRFHAIFVHSSIQSVTTTTMFLLHLSRLCFIYVKVTNQKFRDVFTWLPSCSGAVFPLNFVYLLTLMSTVIHNLESPSPEKNVKSSLCQYWLPVFLHLILLHQNIRGNIWGVLRCI